MRKLQVSVGKGEPIPWGKEERGTFKRPIVGGWGRGVKREPMSRRESLIGSHPGKGRGRQAFGGGKNMEKEGKREPPTESTTLSQ